MIAASDTAALHRRGASLGAICAAAGLVWLSNADVAAALPTIADDFDASLTTLQWANIAYTLVTGSLVIAAGRLGDLRGRKRMLLAGVAVLGVASAVAAAAPGPGTLIAGRALMGVGAALILPATLALIPGLFPGPEQPRALSVWQAVAWGGQAVGPAYGGLLTQSIGWRWIFWLNLPLAAGTLVAIRRTTPESRDDTAPRGIDLPGVVTTAGAAFALLYACTSGQIRGFGDPLVLGLFALAVVLGIAFVVVERRAVSPLVDLRLFSRRTFDAALVANVTMNLLVTGLTFLAVLYLQDVLDYDPLVAGLALLPGTLGILALIKVGERWATSRGPRRPILVGLAGMAAGALLLGLLVPDWVYPLVALDLVLFGAAVGLMSTPVSDSAVGHVSGIPERLAGMASGVFKMSSMLGSSLGVALFVTAAKLFGTDAAVDEGRAAGLSGDQLDTLRGALADSDLARRTVAALDDDTRQRVLAAGRDAFTTGVANAMKASALVALLAAAVVLAVWPRTPPTAPQGQEEPP